MYFSILFLITAVATLTSAVQFTNPSFQITAQSPFVITWTDAKGPVTLTLKDGPSNNLKTVGVIASGLSGGSFTWTPSSTLGSNPYALEISDSTNDPNYSVQFHVADTAPSASTVTPTSTSSSYSGTRSSTTGSSTTPSTSTPSTSTPSTSTSSASPTSTTNPNSTTTTTTSASASRTSSPTSSESRTSSHTSSHTSTGTSTGTARSTSTSTPTPNPATVNSASPLAFIFLAFAAIITLH